MTLLGTGRWPLAAEDELVQGLAHLECEIRTAMSAITENDLASLEHSVREQETLCTHFQVLLKAVGPDLLPSALQQVQAAVISVRDLSRTYRLLVEHAGVSAEQLRRLCQTYTLQGRGYRDPKTFEVNGMREPHV